MFLKAGMEELEHTLEVLVRQIVQEYEHDTAIVCIDYACARVNHKLGS